MTLGRSKGTLYSSGTDVEAKIADTGIDAVGASRNVNYYR
jgi:hypothetical protein